MKPERLTYKSEFAFIETEPLKYLPMKPIYTRYCESVSNMTELLNKLGALEDIEEKLKIDLCVMFKAMKNGIFTTYLCEERGGYIPPHDLVVWEGQLYRKPMGQPFNTDMFPFWKYGKDWALTKEELEDKK